MENQDEDESDQQHTRKTSLASALSILNLAATRKSSWASLMKKRTNMITSMSPQKSIYLAILREYPKFVSWHCNYELTVACHRPRTIYNECWRYFDGSASMSLLGGHQHLKYPAELVCAVGRGATQANAQR